jgi:hypothetical protein
MCIPRCVVTQRKTTFTQFWVIYSGLGSTGLMGREFPKLISTHGYKNVILVFTGQNYSLLDQMTHGTQGEQFWTLVVWILATGMINIYSRLTA